MPKLISIFLVLILLISCSSDDDNPANFSNCDTLAQLPENINYSQIDTTIYTITNVELFDDCLEVTISASGCDGSTWEMNLYSPDSFYNSVPPQRNVKVELINNEACLAVISKTISFDLTPFQKANFNPQGLIIEGWNEEVIYEY